MWRFILPQSRTRSWWAIPKDNLRFLSQRNYCRRRPVLLINVCNMLFGVRCRRSFMMPQTGNYVWPLSFTGGIRSVDCLIGLLIWWRPVSNRVWPDNGVINIMSKDPGHRGQMTCYQPSYWCLTTRSICCLIQQTSVAGDQFPPGIPKKCLNDQNIHSSHDNHLHLKLCL